MKKVYLVYTQSVDECFQPCCIYQQMIRVYKRIILAFIRPTNFLVPLTVFFPAFALYILISLGRLLSGMPWQQAVAPFH